MTPINIYLARVIALLLLLSFFNISYAVTELWKPRDNCEFNGDHYSQSSVESYCQGYWSDNFGKTFNHTFEASFFLTTEVLNSETNREVHQTPVTNTDTGLPVGQFKVAEIVCVNPDTHYINLTTGLCVIDPCEPPDVFDNETEQCETHCIWPEVLNELTGKCELFEDCSPGEIPDPDNPFQCIEPPCADTIGKFQRADYGIYWAQSEAGVSGPLPSPFCVAGCVYSNNDIDIYEVVPGSGCGTINGKKVCAGPTGFNISISGIGTGVECEGDSPTPECTTCESPPIGEPPDPPEPKPNPNDPQPEPEPADTKTSTTESTTDNGDGTTTTTRITVHPDGSTTTETTTTNTVTGDSSSVTTASPGEAQGDDTSARDNGCGQPVSCTGDPIACVALQVAKNEECLQEDVFGAESNDSFDVDLELSSWVSEQTAANGDFTDLDEGGALDSQIDLTAVFDTTKTITAQCPADYTFTWKGKSYTYKFSAICSVFIAIGLLVKIFSAVIFFRIVFGAF